MELINGLENTTILRTKLKEQGWAVNVCYNTIINDKHCYLPSLGQLKIIEKYIDIINELLIRVGYNAFPIENISYWSSALGNKSEKPNDGSSTSFVEDWYIYIVYGCVFKKTFAWGLNCQGYYNAMPITDL